LPISVHTTGGCLNLNAPASAGSPERQSSVFGSGPVISWGTSAAPKVVRFYDLMGRHEHARFRTTDWLSASAAAESIEGFGGMAWQRVDVSVEGVRAVRLSVRPNVAQPYVFGFAIDPDLGSDAGDDTSGYDSARSMVYVADRDRAFGIVLLDGNRAGPATIWQYGAARFSPGEPERVWAAQRVGARNLIAGRGDSFWFPAQSDQPRARTPSC
ncbi:MAG: hypothetical protein ACREMA_18130, partial [Longimicrobiales bacterium]